LNEKTIQKVPISNPFTVTSGLAFCYSDLGRKVIPQILPAYFVLETIRIFGLWL
jgi:hypothetical protein